MTRRSPAAIAIGSLVREKDWQRQVTDAAELFGWSWVHFRPARTERGWRTPVSGPLGAGWFDLVLVRPGRGAVLVELKSATGTISADQKAAHDLLRRAGCEVYVWRPFDLPAALEVLR